MNLITESYRKFLHLLLIIIPLTFIFLGKWKTIIILSPVTIFVVSFDYMRRENDAVKILFAKIFGKILRPHELDGAKLCGASWVFLGATINFAVFSPAIAVTSFLILVISDALAALVGKSIASQPFFEKSFSGSMAFFISALMILILCGIYYHCGVSFYLFGIFAVLCVTIVEARPSLIAIDDNFSIPIIFSIVMSFFDILWNYSY